MDFKVNISGVANIGGTYKNIVLNTNNFQDNNIKEIMYSTEFGEVETLFGFSDLDIIELEDTSTEVHNARVFLRDDEFAQGIVFLRNGFLVITDLLFFSAYTRIDGKERTYSSIVESDTHEDEIAINMIEDDSRLE